VLELGCGTGLPTAAALTAAGCVVTGLDGSPVMVALARRNVPGATFLRRDVAASLSGLGYYDAVVAFPLLTLPRATAVAVLEAVHLALRPGGHLLLGASVPEPPRTPTRAAGARLSLVCRPTDELLDVLRSAGFQVASADVTIVRPEEHWRRRKPTERQILVVAQRVGEPTQGRPHLPPPARKRPTAGPGRAPRPAARAQRTALVSSTSPTAAPARPATPRLPCSPRRAR
jgi:SAM-dependent methyltransferase